MLSNEETRLNALHQLHVLDTQPSEGFDRITRMASHIFQAPIAAVSLTDRDRQWFKSRVGVEHSSIPRDGAPCAAVAESTGMVVVPDLLADPCYADSLLARSGIRFYAGAPLVTREGYGLGSLCVLDTQPRQAKSADLAALSDLAGMVMSQFDLEYSLGRIDQLSGLPNRLQFLEDMEKLAETHPEEPRVLVLIDIAHTDQISRGVRAMGISFIDEIVKETAQVIRDSMIRKRPIYHVSTTQFAILAPEEMEQDAYLELLGATMAHLRENSQFRFLLTAALGVAPFVTGRMSPDNILRAANSAAQDARSSETQISVYSPARDQLHRRRFELLNDFGAALAQPGQLRLVFQPRIDLATGRCVGAEALLRWAHPRLGAIAPDEFIPVVEQSRLSKPITDWVLDTALSQLSCWQARGLDISLSVNISAINLQESDFVERVKACLAGHHVQPGKLELEVTESAMMQKSDYARTQLQALRAVGVCLAIDDFGTGYSSLAYLQQLPAQVVKVDRAFMRGIEDCERERSLVRSLISLSQDLGYRVVAEGVETARAAEILVEMKCDEAQGYFFARPLEAEDFVEWLIAHRQLHPAISELALASA